MGNKAGKSPRLDGPAPRRSRSEPERLRNGYQTSESPYPEETPSSRLEVTEEGRALRAGREAEVEVEQTKTKGVKLTKKESSLRKMSKSTSAGAVGFTTGAGGVPTAAKGGVNTDLNGDDSHATKKAGKKGRSKSSAGEEGKKGARGKANGSSGKGGMAEEIGGREEVERAPRELELKVYRSYSNLTDPRNAIAMHERSLETVTSNIRVLRRSTEKIGDLTLDSRASSTLQPSHRTMSLPRGIGRTRSSASSAPTRADPGRWRGGGGGEDGRPSPPSSMSDLRGSTTFSTLLPSVSLGPRTSSIRGSTLSTLSCQSTMTGYKVNRDDFPDTCSVRRRVKQFEGAFVNSFLDRYTRLPPVTQLSALAVALRVYHAHPNDELSRRRAGKVAPVSLWDYLRGDDEDVEEAEEGDFIPVDLDRRRRERKRRREGEEDWSDEDEEDEEDEFVLCVPSDVFSSIMRVRLDCKMAPLGDEPKPAPDDVMVVDDDWVALSRDVVKRVATEAVAEIVRMYEYQVALLFDEISFQLVADQAAERSLDYIIPYQDPSLPVKPLTMARLDRNTIVQGVVRGRPARPGDGGAAGPPPPQPKFISVIVGEKKELKWNIYEIFSRPGLRREILLTRADIPSPDDDDRSPFTFHTTATSEISRPAAGGRGGRRAGAPLASSPGSSDHMRYGYRGPLLDWDWIEGVYRVNAVDDRRYTEESAWRYDDFHRLYVPFQCLIGAKAMKKYYYEVAQARASLTGQGVGGGAGGRDTSGGQRHLPLKLDEYLRELIREGTGYTRDIIVPIYRPLECFNIPGRDTDRSSRPRGNPEGGNTRSPGHIVQSSNVAPRTFDINTTRIAPGSRPANLGSPEHHNVEIRRRNPREQDSDDDDDDYNESSTASYDTPRHSGRTSGDQMRFKKSPPYSPGGDSGGGGFRSSMRKTIQSNL